ncbi:S8 family serine peptidase [Phycicoccus sp. Root563]|uniref:S8 family serine peptidase n=1 Tax=Phycicoccus sp. Root563 TaxID=1736562 RepID=UPI000AA4DFEE|nr:S8 family serine peptidase [Phycicoccus sp. Root563]
MRRIIAMAGAAAAALCMATTPSWAATASPTSASPAKSSVVPSVTKSATGSYIVVMKADPLVRSMKVKDLGTPRGRERKAALRATHDAVLKRAGVSTTQRTTDYSNAVNGFAVRTSLRSAEKIARDPGVALVLPDELRQPTAVASDSRGHDDGRGLSVNGLNRFLGLTGKGDAYARGITGKGVLVGVIDTGIWPEHPSFAARPGLPAAPVFDTAERSACAFGNTAWNPNDKPFACNNKLVGAREFLDTYKANQGLEAHEFDSARDNEGHGTHTASTAAGNGNVRASIFGVGKGVVSGIAPDAQVIAYKALGDLGGFTSDLADAIDQAVADGVDVINYSIGGGAQTVSADTIAFLFAADADVFTAVSAGNSGPGAATIGGPADVPWVTGVGATTYPTFYKGVVKLGNGRSYVGGSVTRGTARAEFVDGARAGSAGSDLCLAGTLDPAKVTGKIVLCGRGTNGRIEKSFEVQRAGGIGMVLYNQNDVDNIFTDNFFVPTVMVDNSPGTAIRTWVNSTAHPVGSLVNGGISKAPFPTPTVASFSSRGENPTSGDIIKPDISAPGVQIMAGNTPFPSPGTQPAGELFQAIAGTSMSGPVVAGSYALLKQAHPDWSAAAAKSALMTTADTRVRDNDRRTQAGPFAMGAGLAVVGEPGEKGSAFRPGLVYDAGFLDYLGFLCAEGPEAFSNPDATCASLRAAGVPTVASDLNYASIGAEAVPGATTVTRTVTNVSGKKATFTARSSAPPGYSVKVTPSTLRLAPDESATFTVTLTNGGQAPSGEWRFGSLTWAGSGYAVRSAIAVKGVDIATPATVSGTGTSGTASIPVQFGRAGAYTATPHGLVPATDTNGTIDQDPDQTYPSADDGSGVDQIPFTVSGVNLARWSLVLPGATDLDLYLRGPDGSIVAQSTNGGTNEEITLENPADGTYTMVVHGWAVGTPGTAYDLRSWLVPDATGGSLQVTSGSPVTATVGGSTTVGLAWSGLTAGTDYLGTVSHAIGGVGVATTVVSVTG